VLCNAAAGGRNDGSAPPDIPWPSRRPVTPASPPTARLCLTETKNVKNCLSGYDDKHRIRNWHPDDAGCIPPLVGAAGLVVLCNAAAVAAMVMALAGVPQEVDTTLNTFRVTGTPAAWPPLDPFLSGTN
jgi:hypothetical protein